MQIKSLVALLPLLLGQVSSVALPAAPDSCGAVEARLRRNADLQDVPKHLLSRCVQRRELEAHLELVSRDIQQWEPSNNDEGHIISARAPPKDDNGNTEKKKPGRPKGSGKKKDVTPAPAGPAGSQAEKSAEGKKKQKQDPASPGNDQNQPQQHANLALRPAGKGKQQPQAPADGSGSGGQSSSEAEKKKPEEEKKKAEGEKDKGKQKANPPSDGPSDGDSSPSESESDSEGEDSGDDYEPPSHSEDDSEDERRKKKEANEEARKKKKEDREKQKAIDKERAPKTMYHAVTPDPKKSEGIKDKGTKEEDRYYLRKIGDGLPRNRYKTHNPAHSVVESGDQEPGREKTETDPGQKRPGRIEEEATTGHKSGKGYTEWHKITPHPQSELDKDPETKGKKPWTNDDLAENLIKQQKEFPDHKAGDKNSEYAKTTKEMLKYCKAEQCRVERRALARRAFPGEMHLRRELETRLQRRDDMINMRK